MRVRTASYAHGLGADSSYTGELYRSYTSNYGGYVGSTPEEQAAIDRVVAEQANNWAAGMSSAMGKMGAANGEASAKAAEANRAICAKNELTCDSNPCFADSHRPGYPAVGDSTINADYNHIGVSCVGPTNTITWFNRSQPVSAMAALFGSHSQADTLAEHRTSYGYADAQGDNARTYDRVTGQSVGGYGNQQPTIIYMAAPGGNAGAGAGAGAGIGLPTVLTTPIDIAGYSVSPLLLAGAALLALFAFKK